MTLTPIDTLKTTQQTQGGKAGLKLLRDRIKENGIGCLWWGALATAAATFAGNCESYLYLLYAVLISRPMVRDIQLFIGETPNPCRFGTKALCTSYISLEIG